MGLARCVAAQGEKARALSMLRDLKRDALSDGMRATVTALRSVLMKPEHLDWLDRLWTLLDAATGATG